MKTSKKTFALCVFVAALAASCSNMMEELKPKAGPELPSLAVKEASVSVPGCVISVTVDGSIPESSKPKAKYKKPDGTVVEIEGTVEKNDDGTSTIKFDMNPVPADLPEGELPVTVSVAGYKDATVKVDYVPPKPLHIKGEPKMENPGTKITVVVEDDIPETPKPKLKYTITKPDGSTEEIEVEGSVTDNGDGTKTITYDLDPIPQELMGGTLPITFDVPGCLPTDADVNYIPDLEILGVKVGDTEGVDSVDIYNSEAEGLPEPEILTNYHDNVDIETSYVDQSGNPMTWDQVKVFIGDYHNDGKYVVVKYNAVPNPDRSPSQAKDGEAKIYCRKDLPIASAKVTPESKMEEGQEAEAKAYTSSGTVYNGPVNWQWHKAKVVGGTDEEIDGATDRKFTPDESYIGYLIWAKATQLATGTVKESNKIEVKAKAVLDYEVLENYSLSMTCADQGQNVFEFSAVTNIPSPTLVWYVDGAQKQSGASKDYALDLAAYELGWHNVEVRSFKDGTPYSARKSVKRKAEQSAPVVDPSQVVKVSAFGERDGKITGLEDTMEWSDDGGLTYKPVQGGEISGLPEGTVKIRRAGDDDKAASAPMSVDVPTQTYSVTAPGSVTGGSLTASASTVKVGETVTISISALEGYELDAIGATCGGNPVALSGSGNERTFTMPNGDVAVTGSFKKLKYSVTVNAGDNGQVTSSATEPVEWGTEITLTIAPAQDYVLDAIGATSGGSAVPLTGDDSQKTFTMPKGDVTVTASFKKKAFALTLSPEGYGTLSAVPSGDVAWDTSVTITINPNADYKLSAIVAKDEDEQEVPLSDGESENQKILVMPKKAVNVKATFVKKVFALNYSAGDHGSIVSVKDSQGNDIANGATLEWGESVTVKVAPDANYVVDKLTVNDAAQTVTSNTCVFSMPKSEAALSVTFKQDLVFDTRATGVVVVYNKNNTGAAAYNYVTASHWNANKTKYQNAGWKAVGVAFYNYVEGVMHNSSSYNPGPDNIGDKNWYMIALDITPQNTKNWNEASSWASSYSKEGLTGWMLPTVVMPNQTYHDRDEDKMDQVIVRNVAKFDATLESIGATKISSIQFYWGSGTADNYGGMIDFVNSVNYDGASGCALDSNFPAVMLVHSLP